MDIGNSFKPSTDSKPIESKPVPAPVIENKPQPPVAPPKTDVKAPEPKKVSKLFADSDDDEEEETKAPVKAPQAKPIEPPVKEAPKPVAPVENKPAPPKPVAQSNQDGNDFKNSLASLLSKGNPLMPGMPRKTVTQPKKTEEEAAPAKDKIKFDIFNNEDDTTDYMKKTVLDNVIINVI